MLRVFIIIIAVFLNQFVVTNLYAENKEQHFQESDKLDDRLPPVIPGEEIKRNGKKIKVWSTSGSPSVLNTPPPPPVAPGNNQEYNSGDDNRDVSIILDDREIHRKHNRP